MYIWSNNFTSTTTRRFARTSQDELTNQLTNNQTKKKFHVQQQGQRQEQR